MSNTRQTSPTPSRERQKTGIDGGGVAPVTTNQPPERANEVGGPSGPEPTRYGDWERNGRCVDF